jgi:hypothetical protein
MDCCSMPEGDTFFATYPTTRRLTSTLLVMGRRPAPSMSASATLRTARLNVALTIRSVHFRKCVRPQLFGICGMEALFQLALRPLS